MAEETNFWGRSDVYASIDGELDYQFSRFGPNPHEIDAWATYIRRYSTVLDSTCTTSETPKAKLEVIRKIAAICVRCLEQHGAPKREGFDAS